MPRIDRNIRLDEDGEYCWEGNLISGTRRSGGGVGSFVKASQDRLRKQSEAGVLHPHRDERTDPNRGYKLSD